VIPIASGVRVWIATGHTDMRRGMNSLGLLVQEAFKRDPHGGDLYVFRGKSDKLIKILWHDGLGMSLYAKRLERGRFLWPSSADGVVTITPAQLGYLLEGIDWRMPQHTWRPRAACCGCSAARARSRTTFHSTSVSPSAPRTTSRGRSWFRAEDQTT
jgi:transposase